MAGMRLCCLAEVQIQRPQSAAGPSLKTWRFAGERMEPPGNVRPALPFGQRRKRLTSTGSMNAMQRGSISRT